LKYKDLKQFKTTLECVELLSKKKFSTKKSNLNIDDAEQTLNIQELRNKLFFQSFINNNTTMLNKKNRKKKQQFYNLTESFNMLTR